MSRSGYVDDWDYDDWSYALCLGKGRQSIKGKRGQAFSEGNADDTDRNAGEAPDCGASRNARGRVCAIGSVGKARGVDMSKLDPEDAEGVGAAFGIAQSMAREIVYVNDEGAT